MINCFSFLYADPIALQTSWISNPSTWRVDGSYNCHRVPSITLQPIYVLELKSNIKLADMRDSALCDRHANVSPIRLLGRPLDFVLTPITGFEEERTHLPRSFFSEIISSISDVKVQP